MPDKQQGPSATCTDACHFDQHSCCHAYDCDEHHVCDYAVAQGVCQGCGRMLSEGSGMVDGEFERDWHAVHDNPCDDCSTCPVQCGPVVKGSTP